MNYYIFNHIIDYLQPKEIIRFLLHSNKNMINSIDWDHINNKFNYTDKPANIQFPYSEGFNTFFNNFKLGINQISCGCDHSLILKNDNTLWGTGYNYYGQLGLGHTDNQYTFVQILEQDTPDKLLRRPVDNIKSVSCGYYHTFILKNDNTLWGTGKNKEGQLGLGNTNNQNTFVQLLEQDTPAKLLRRPIDNIKSVSCGSMHSLILKNDNTLWGTGSNNCGQLGFVHIEKQHTFVQLYIDNIKSVSCGSDHSLILKNDNTLWGTGSNNCGQLGFCHIEKQHTFVQLHINNIKSVSCSSHHSLILKNDNTLWGTGNNYNGQLGLGHSREQNTFVQSPIDDIKNISGGYHDTIILKNDNTLWGSGDNYKGRLGLGHTNNQYTFVQILQQDTPAKLLHRPIDNIKSVSGGSGHTLILKNDNTLWGSGHNYRGQLGLGHTDEQHTFIQLSVDNIKSVSCSSDHSLILKNDNTLWASEIMSMVD
jgi:alpha-tubulin suppressor-like RCC1 family protein